MEVRLIVDAPASGAQNMAVDEVLLASASEHSIASLRFYGWSEPVVTLGYFQSYAAGESHVPSRDCPRIRRSTGGGAIVHDRELTYSFAVPLRDRWAAAPQAWYDLMHETLVGVLADLQIEARQHAKDLAETDEAFLCFQRRAVGDVVVGEYKVCGSAQRRHRNAMLQHGSLLLARSPQAPELPGLAELGGSVMSSEDLRQAWLKKIKMRHPLSFMPGKLSEDEQRQVERMMAERYSVAAWNRKR